MMTKDEILATEHSREFCASVLALLPTEIDDAQQDAIDAFLERSQNRLLVSFYKYGYLRDAYPEKVDALSSLAVRLNKYRETRNTENLIDAFNFAMIEFMHPRHQFLSSLTIGIGFVLLREYLAPGAGAFFQATDASGSPGRVTATGLTQAANKDIHVDAELKNTAIIYGGG